MTCSAVRENYATSRRYAGPYHVACRFQLVANLGLEEAICAAELTARGVPPQTMHALRVLFGTAKEVRVAWS